MEVEIGDVGLEWHGPEILMGTSPSLFFSSATGSSIKMLGMGFKISLGPPAYFLRLLKTFSRNLSSASGHHWHIFDFFYRFRLHRTQHRKGRG